MFKLFTFMCIVTSFNVIACSDTSVEAVDAFFQKLSMIEIREGVINSNIQNAQTTRTATGGPYKVRVIKGCESGSCTIKILKKEVVFKYEPNHPDVDERGYVAYPNINVVQEMEKLIKVVRVPHTFEACQTSHHSHLRRGTCIRLNITINGVVSL